jgi:hypothetical protein
MSEAEKPLGLLAMLGASPEERAEFRREIQAEEKMRELMSSIPTSETKH